MIDREEISGWFQKLQLQIISQLEAADGKAKFKFDDWQRAEGGGGKSSIIELGNIIEKGGVNYSAVYGDTPQFLIQSNEALKNTQFYATGVSIVIHPKSPLVPIIHMNVRYFEAGKDVYWFGGGIDLTPHYINLEDATYFHESLKAACDEHDSGYYAKFKKWADDYFYIPHRQETRGIGGIFFDHLSGTKEEKTSHFEFVKSIGSLFAPLYVSLMHKNGLLTYTEQEKNWQYIRRGRYAEFNLVYDKGTRFGLETNGRTESILMSLPPRAEWVYNHIPAPGSKEYETVTFLKKDIHWVKASNGIEKN